MKKNIGKYPIEAEIGTGGMGKVYLGRHPALNKPVAIKEMIIPTDSQSQRRFERESSILFDFSHPHIIKYIDSCQDKKKGIYYLVMEYIDGRSLDKLIQDKIFIRPDVTILIAAMVCDGLQYAHDHQIIHRDIKSSNIFLSREGTVKIGDFGISAFTETQESTLTLTGQLVGTPAYMPPEIFNSGHEMKSSTPAMDIYSMGVVIYEMLLGKNPFEQPTIAGTIKHVVTNTYSSFDLLPQSTPGGMIPVIRKCLKEKPQERYQTARELKKDLLEIINLPPEHLDDLRVTTCLQDYLAGRIQSTECLHLPVQRSKISLIHRIAGISSGILILVLITLIWFLHPSQPNQSGQSDQSRYQGIVSDSLIHPNKPAQSDTNRINPDLGDTLSIHSIAKTTSTPQTAKPSPAKISKPDPGSDSLMIESVMEKYKRYVRFKIRMENPNDEGPKPPLKKKPVGPNPPLKKKPRRPPFEPPRFVTIYYHDQNSTQDDHVTLDTPVKEYDHDYFISQNIQFTSDSLFVRFQSNQFYEIQSNAFYCPIKDRQDTTILITMALLRPLKPN